MPNIKVQALSPVGELELDSQAMTGTQKSFFHKRPRSNRNTETDSKGGEFEKAARATHKSDFAVDEVESTQFHPKIIIESGGTTSAMLHSDDKTSKQ